MQKIIRITVNEEHDTRTRYMYVFFIAYKIDALCLWCVAVFFLNFSCKKHTIVIKLADARILRSVSVCVCELWRSHQSIINHSSHPQNSIWLILHETMATRANTMRWTVKFAIECARNSINASRAFFFRHRLITSCDTDVAMCPVSSCPPYGMQKMNEIV